MAGRREALKKTRKIVIDPVNRIEGHLKVEVEVSGGKVVDAHCTTGLFRGFEIILKGRDPRDAAQITQRICGVCPTSHGTASVLCLDSAFGVKPTTNGRIVRNLILVADHIWDHILHFYHLVALDYVKGPNVPPFVPRYEGKGIYKLPPEINDFGVKGYLKALEIRRVGHEMTAIFGGRGPHVHGLVVGGATVVPTADAIVGYLWRLKEIEKFYDEIYLPTVYAVAKYYPEAFTFGAGCKNFLSYGVYPLNDDYTEFLLKPGVYTDGEDKPFDPEKITEYVKYSFYNDSITGLNPKNGKTHLANPDKPGAYSFTKAPRYDGKPHEVGPLARMWVANPVLSRHASEFLGKKGEVRMRDFGEKAFSVLGRLVARAEEGWLEVKAAKKWITELKPGAPVYKNVDVPETGVGFGCTEAPRGSVGHWIRIRDKKIANYQVVAPTTWNVSPRDDTGTPGPIEQALIGTPVPDPKNPVNVVRVIRSFDP
ncbi:MAG: nickel-dependent hydrogenase large subunit [Candidatus Desulfofervidaceae bacterium]|nr:nickel-dependent hydrogenase large subunit [Candidatus Desulfofervidaceae bacterium]